MIVFVDTPVKTVVTEESEVVAIDTYDFLPLEFCRFKLGFEFIVRAGLACHVRGVYFSIFVKRNFG